MSDVKDLYEAKPQAPQKIVVQLRVDDLRDDINAVADEADDEELNELLTDVLHRWMPDGTTLSVEVDLNSGTLTVVKPKGRLS